MKRPIQTLESINRLNAERVAALALALCAGRSPEQVAADVAARVIHKLRNLQSTRPQ